MTTQIYLATNRHQQRARRLAVGLVVALFAVGLVAACGNDDDANAALVAPDDAAGAVDDATPEPTDGLDLEPEPTSVDVDALLAAWAVYAEDAAETEAQNLQRGFLAEAEAAGADPSQLVILASGPISWADYEAAMNRSIACIEALGRPVWQNLQQNTAPWPDVIATNIPAQGATTCDGTRCWREELEGAELAAWQCHVHYAWFVEQAWTQAVPEVLAGQQERKIIYLALMAQCLQARGIDVADNPSYDELWAIREALWEESPNCQRAFLDNDGSFIGWQCDNITPDNELVTHACEDEVWTQVAEIMANR